jgi:ankyrin repeat protein
MGGLRLDQKQSAVGTAIIPGKAADSRVMLRINSSTEGFRMPLAGAPLSHDQIRIIKTWIDAGAPWPEASGSGRALAQQPDQKTKALFAAIRKCDLRAGRSALREPRFASASAASGVTPLMYASLYSNSEMISLLLHKGADPNSQNADGATALMWAVDDVKKAKLLLGAGARVNARSQEGNTALIIAAATSGSGRVIQELIDRGADVNARNSVGDTALVYAASYGDRSTLAALIAKGANVEPGGSILTPLTAAAYYGNLDAVKELLARGAHINAQDCCATAIFYPAAFGDKEMLKFLIARRANVNFNSVARILTSPAMGTPLMWAAYAEAQDPDLVQMLIAKGADVNARTAEGHTALSRARPRGKSAVVNTLLQAGANDFVPSRTEHEVSRSKSVPLIQAAVERSLTLLQSSGTVWYKNRSCVSCHHQSLPAVAVAEARERGFRVDEQAARQLSAKTAAFLENTREALLQMMTADPGVPGGAHSAGYALLALDAEKHPPDEVTDAMVRFIAAKQLQDGRWRPDAPRPPLEYSDVSATALCLHALQTYGDPRRTPKYAKRIQLAKRWLRSAQPRFNEERIFQLLGLTWGGGSRQDLQRLSTAVLAEQRENGGWSQLRTLPSDAYATGQALFALYESGLPVSHPAYQRGVKFLLETQCDDGSWWVRSRSFPIQPYFESGFPHGKDQFISATGTSWAAIALAVTKKKSH